MRTSNRMKDVVGKEIWIVSDRRNKGLVARKWLDHRGSYLPSRDAKYGADLDALRAQLPPGLARRDRAPGDASSIVEIWI